MKKSKLQIAVIILSVIVMITFIITTILYALTMQVFAAQKAAEEAGESSTQGLGLLFTLPFYLMAAGVSGGLAIVSTVMSSVAIAKRDTIGRLPLSIVFLSINVAIIAFNIVYLITVFSHAG